MMYNLKKFTDLFNQLARLQSHSEVFSIFLDFALIGFQYGQDDGEMEKCLQRIHHENARQMFVDMILEIGKLADADGKGLQDPLGEFFMTEISKGHNGQYFTPEHICDFMNAIVAPEELQNGKRVLDPACGSGRMLLSAAKANRNLLFYGADVDSTCARMAVINMLMNGLTGEIAQLNSLSNEFYCGYKVGIKNFYGYSLPGYEKFTDPAESYIHLKIKQDMNEKLKSKMQGNSAQSGAQQGLLFE